MGFFDKAKHFMGGHGVKVEIVKIERQTPSEARMSMTDTVVKGTCRIVTEKDCNVLAHKFEFVLKHKNKEGIEQEQVLASDQHDHSTDIIGGDIKWPYDLAAGTPIEDGFLVIMQENIPTVVRNLGYTNPVDAINTGAVKFFLRATADVKGSPFDPKGEAELKIVP
jgi:hypothetical protein